MSGELVCIVLSEYAKGARGCMMTVFGGEGDIWGHLGKAAGI